MVQLRVFTIVQNTLERTITLPGKFAMVFEIAFFVVKLRVQLKTNCTGKNAKTAILSFMVLEFSCLKNSE